MTQNAGDFSGWQMVRCTTCEQWYRRPISEEDTHECSETGTQPLLCDVFSPHPLHYPCMKPKGHEGQHSSIWQEDW
ncbi:hypothetical protein SEA_KABOCHA_98 [Gordonia phage Kabocha]|uniref:Uncharacterized protein n=2 Tax=Chidieberevirus TaxID=3044687 RepID=A0A649VLG9_9CAUD|nr:hypothetical protein PQD14_gp097 [Gordonia phage Chidiebere]YP_010675741.1 hypothetical protein PQD15_gp094 [Gordonia phage ChisanaKitsune]AZS07976.1 hypothetical protein PBI_GRAY_97 [Gordonia phage Gray]WAA19884.1 hypothetical protein SEA_KABOCHA_98 [Gordonia phage Kabocha]WAA20073.1 hypothetical protein SEA_HANEM_96 [Gordonia phage Hanem]WNM67116.1 hypothetical protein SEA_SCHOMBER_95 [Gordonia Phage Schomber]QGJ92985.1 hypothetical protein PBI_CHIDIEBERE_97 [Gordonia phage Chidiebere]